MYTGIHECLCCILMFWGTDCVFFRSERCWAPLLFSSVVWEHAPQDSRPTFITHFKSRRDTHLSLYPLSDPFHPASFLLTSHPSLPLSPFLFSGTTLLSSVFTSPHHPYSQTPAFISLLCLTNCLRLLFPPVSKTTGRIACDVKRANAGKQSCLRGKQHWQLLQEENYISHHHNGMLEYDNVHKGT